MGGWTFSFRVMMKLVIYLFLCCYLTQQGLAQDPVNDYLKKQAGDTGSSIKSDNHPFITFRELPYHSDDLLFRYEVDLNNDGINEVLISSTLEADGNQGSVWRGYQFIENRMLDIGMMTFSRSRFYVGPLEGGKYGLASFGPAGAGEGTMWGYVFEGNSIDQIKLGGVVLNRQTMKLEGEEIVGKYLGEKAITGDEVVQVIQAKELAEKYGVKIDPRTYREALAEEMQIAKNNQATTFVSPTQTTPVTAATAPVQQPKPAVTPPPTLQAESPKSFPWPWIIGAILLLAVASGVLLKLRRK